MSVCRSCIAPLPDGALFCPSCGARADVGEREPVRKLVTILFSDVVGSTAMAEVMDAEALAQVMTAYFSEMSTVILRHGGVVEKYIGDAILGVFGFPTVHEDDALRACRAAAEMRAVLSTLNERFQATWALTLQTRTGVNTGEVVAAPSSRDQTLPLGDPANVAARLESAAAPGEIYIGESTWSLVLGSIEAEPLEPLALKGKAERVPAWRLIHAAAGSRVLSERIDSPIVGRGAELSALTDLFEATVGERSCGLVTVIGDPGVGKSRLALEFLNRLDGRACVLRGRSLAYGEGITFWPLGEILKQAADIGERHSSHEAIAALDRLLAGQRDRERVVALLASAVGWLEVSYPMEEVAWAARMALEHLALRMPLVVVFEDIHWAERSFLDLIENVARRSEGVPLMLLCTARPDLLDEQPDWDASRRGHTVIRLDPLSDEESHHLAAGLLGVRDLPHDVDRSLAVAAAGNPLFIQQLIGMWVDEGVLVGDGEALRLTVDPRSLAVPASLRSLLQSRLDRLPAEERSLLERAAVIGQVFQRAGLLALSDADVRAADAGLEALTARAFIEPYSESSAPEPSYRFHHVLLRDATYEGTLKSRRAALHERFGRWLRRTVEHRLMEYEELVGYHFEQACSYLSDLGAPDEHARAMAREASDHLAAAGRRALGREDATAAANLLSRAGALLPEGSAIRLGLLPDLGEALHQTGRMADAETVLREAIDAGAASGDLLLRARAMVPWIGLQPYVDPGWSPQRERRIVDEIVPVFQEAGDERGLAGALIGLAGEPEEEGRFDDIERITRRVMVHAARAGDLRREAEARAYLCTICLYGPTPVREAIVRSRETLAWTAGRTGTRRSEGLVLRDLGVLEGMAGRFEEARHHLADSVTIFENLGLQGPSAGTQLFAGELELLAGRPEAAEAILRRALAPAEALGAYQHGVAIRLAEAALVLDRVEEADELTSKASVWRSSTTRDNRADWRSTRARVLTRLGRLEEAETLAREALGMLAGTGFVEARAGAHRALAEMLREAGLAEGARVEFASALALYQQKGDVVRTAMIRDLSGSPA